jgi:hypothetical protein
VEGLEGLSDGDGGAHLVTYHPCYGRSSAQYFHQDPTLSFNIILRWAESSVHSAFLSDPFLTPRNPWFAQRARTRTGPITLSRRS